MKFSLVILLFSLFVHASSPSGVIEAVDGDRATLTLPGLAVGMSATIERQLNATDFAIMASGSISSVQGDQVTLTLSPFQGLEQSSLPNVNLHVQKGDRAYFMTHYKHTFIIAPTKKAYERLKSGMKEGIHVAHPDRFVTHLNVTGHPAPLKEDFQSFCHQNAIGVLHFALDDATYSVDCQSFKTIYKSQAIAQTGNTKLPMYSRLGEVQTSWFQIMKKEMDDFNQYYKALLND
jgi:hypothetical protein